jgi:probable HAF family extracellular repeat protein
MYHPSRLNLLGICITALCLISVASAQKYAIIHLTLPGGTTSAGLSINDHGQVTGYSDTATSGGSRHAFLYSKGTVKDLSSLFGSTDSSAVGINILGHIVVVSNDTSYLYRNGRVTNLNLVGASAINAHDQVVGSSGLFGWIFSGGQLTKIPMLATEPAVPHSINTFGQVTGEYRALFTPTQFWKPFLYRHGKVTVIDPMPGNVGSVASAINDWGQIAGYGVGPLHHAFIYSHGAYVDIGTLPGGTYSEAYGINNFGHVVGMCDGHACLYDGKTMVDLNTLIPAGAPWTLTAANAINDFGQITGQGQFNGNSQAFLLTPLHDLASLVRQVQSENLDSAVTSSLIDRLKNAANNGKGAVSCSGLDEFASEVRARTGSDIAASQAKFLLSMTNEVRQSEPCQ